MKKSIIAAMSSNHCIGGENKMLWHIPEDLKRFKEITLNHHILMGRKTFESIGKPLPKRTSLIITRDDNYVVPEGCFKFKTIEDAIQFAEKNGENELFIIGGSEIYQQTIDLADTVYLTRLLDKFDGDAYFPAIEYNQFNFRNNQIDRILYNNFEGEKKYSHEFMILDRKIS